MGDEGVTELVERFVELVQGSPGASEEELSGALQRSGIELECAQRLLGFVPLAFGRVWLQGPKFPEWYEIRDSERGLVRRGRVGEEPVYIVAHAVAKRLGRSHEGVGLVASMSAEVRAAEVAVADGSVLANLCFVEPVFGRIPLQPEKRWWRL
jgi:hypothetical protein